METTLESGAAQAEPVLSLAETRPRRKLSRLHVRLAVLVAGSMLPLLILAGFMVMQSYQRATDTAAASVLQTARSVVVAVDRDLESQVAALEILALSPSLRAGDLIAFRAEAERFLTRFPNGSGLSIADPTGQLRLNTAVGSDVPLPPRRDMEGVAQVLATKRPYISQLRIGRISQHPLFTVDVPVIEKGEVLYDLAFSPSLEPFYAMLEALDLPPGYVVSIFDRNGHHIARRPALSRSEMTSASVTLKAELDKGGDNRIVPTLSVEGDSVLTAIARSATSNWAVAIGMPVESLNTPGRQALFAALASGVLLIMIGLIFAGRLATNLMRAEAHRELLLNELNHRVKNTLSSVQAIVARGLHGVDAPVQKKAIEARLLALSHVHNILSSRNWDSADFGDTAHAVLRPYAASLGRRLAIDGPAVRLKPRLAIALAMVLNELVTNAVKYGALSNDRGSVQLTWQVTGKRLTIDWSESGGPPVVPPAKPGYGTRFIERAVGGELGGRHHLAYLRDGFVAVLEVPI